ncbi:MAG: DinB family protein [Pseudonocardia sp.]|nr:DinB family protein [Pseudonocardia sp.]
MHCEECGFHYGGVARTRIGPRIRTLCVAYTDVLTSTPPGLLRRRPRPAVWSPLEYACHVRDVLVVQRHRVDLIQRDHEPDLAPMGREERVTRDRYNQQSPARVAAEIATAAEQFVDRLAELDPDAWLRRGAYSWPVRCLRTVEWIGRHTVHEGEHHLRDLREGIHRGRGAG